VSGCRRRVVVVLAVWRWRAEGREDEEVEEVERVERMWKA
jgi:hypothetical protein